MDKYEQLKLEIANLIDKYGSAKFADAMVQWYGYRSLHDSGDLKEIEKLMR